MNRYFIKKLYFFKNNIKNVSFHNICINKKLPSNPHCLLGLRSKFCIESRLPQEDLINSFSKMSRLIRLKCFIECVTKDEPKGIGNPNEFDFNAKLHAQTKFKQFCWNKLYKFRDMITELHSILPRIPNYYLDKVQRKILLSAWNNLI